MATIATNDTKKKKPSAVQTATFKNRARELRARFFAGILDPEMTNDGLQALMEMTRGYINCNAQPEIPNWARKERPIDQHIHCGMIDPAKLEVDDVFIETDGDYLDGEEFVRRGQALKGAMNACAFDFYSRKENWKYLPEGVDIIVFTQTVFCGSDGSRCVRYLYRHGAGWIQDFRWLGCRFFRSCRVAVFASSPQNSDPKLS